MTLYRFEEIRSQVDVTLKCECGHKTKRTVSGTATINPYNRIDGEIATRAQVMQQARDNAEKEAERVRNQEWRCNACIAGDETINHYRDLPYSEFESTMNQVERLAKEIVRLQQKAREELSHLIDTDIVMDGRAAMITDVGIYNGEAMIGYRYYSKSKRARKGELLCDVMWKRFDRKHPNIVPIEKCQCGGDAVIAFPNYANESVMVVCETCDDASASYPMGPYHEGTDLAIRDWNANAK